MINTEIKLNEVEQNICKAIAKLRFNNNRKSNVKNSKIGKQSNRFTDLEGFGAEFAFCKLHNVFPDFSIQPRSAQDDQGDALLPTGQSVDVKTTKYPTGKLLAVPWKKDNVDLYALMVGQFPTYIFKGFMIQDELLKEERIGSLGYGETYIARQSELLELESINAGG